MAQSLSDLSILLGLNYISQKKEKKKRRKNHLEKGLDCALATQMER